LLNAAFGVRPWRRFLKAIRLESGGKKAGFLREKTGIGKKKGEIMRQG